MRKRARGFTRTDGSGLHEAKAKSARDTLPLWIRSAAMAPTSPMAAATSIAAAVAAAAMTSSTGPMATTVAGAVSRRLTWTFG